MKLEDDAKFKKLRKLLRVVLKSSGFYQRKYKRVGITSDNQVINWSDFYSLPFTSRDELAKDQYTHPPFGTNLTRPLSEYIHLISTSGTTTGMPFFLPLARGDLDRWVGIYERGQRLLGGIVVFTLAPILVLHRDGAGFALRGL